jgi:hypothetical protein
MSDIKGAGGGGGLGQTRRKAAAYYTLPYLIPGGGVGSFAQNRVLYVPTFFDTAFPIDEIGVLVDASQVGGAGCVARFGCYDIGADGLPSALIGDYTTVAVTSAGIALRPAITTLPQGRKWMAVVFQGNATTPNITRGSYALGVPMNVAGGAAAGTSCCFEDGISGGLPAVATPSIVGSFAPPAIVLRAT